MEQSSNGKNIYWTDAKFLDQVKSTNSWETVYGALKLTDIILQYPNVMLKVFIWNNDYANFNINDFKITARKENKLVYAILEDFN